MSYLKPYLDACRAYDRSRGSVLCWQAVVSSAAKIHTAAALGEPIPEGTLSESEKHNFLVRAAVMLDALDSSSGYLAAREIARLQDQVRQAVLSARS